MADEQPATSRYTLVISERILRYGTIEVEATSPTEALRLGRLRYSERGGAFDDDRGEEDLQIPRIDDLEIDGFAWDGLDLEMDAIDQDPTDEQFAGMRAEGTSEAKA